MAQLNRSHLEQARQRLRERGARLTVARTRVLAELLASESALSHADLQKLVDQAPLGEVFDRVTLYRVLDWLVEQQLAHRLTGTDRVYRFSAAGQPDHVHGGHGSDHESHGHFRCRQCERMFCLAEPPILREQMSASVPSGFSAEVVEVTVLGRCATCTEA